jgi:hypothetical protein
MSKLDAVVGMSLRSFYRDICSGWCGRENEAVNLYTFGHLAKQVRPGSPLYDLTQIGIEVAVRQKPLEKFPGIVRTVRKDLVIWPVPRMNLFEANVPHNEPLAIMEWKVNHFRMRARRRKNEREHSDNVEWLREFSLRPENRDFVGYAVLLDNLRTPLLTCTRVHAGVHEQFLTLREGAGSQSP